jgi:metallo-beta-lactamase family protein
MDLQFFGASQQVTGSCFLLRAAGRRLLVECGLFQGPPEVEEKNRQPFPFDPASIDAVILTHAHLDHSGRLPLLINSGFQGPIYTHRATRDLCRILLKDAGYLNEKDAEWENRKRQRKGLSRVEPLYTLHEAAASMKRFRVLDYDKPRQLFPGVRLRLQDAGHILGSSIAELWLTEDGVERKLVFSGDLGHRDAPILQDPVAVREADLVIMESTYGDRLHRPWKETWEELGEVFGNSDRKRGNVLIPAFAVGRTQELLYAFSKHYDDWGMDNWQIFLDSPLAIDATNIYARHRELYDTDALGLQYRNGSLFELPNLQFTKTTLQSMALNRIQSGAVIIAGSGMCTGGRIKHHLKHNLWRRNSHLVIVGFQAMGTLGRALVDGAEKIQLWGETIKVAARIHTIGGFSAHADCQGLVNWYRQFEERPPLALVHGEPLAINALQQRLRDELQAPVFAPEEGDRIDLRRLGQGGAMGGMRI